MPWGKKNTLFRGKSEKNGISRKALEIRDEMIHIFEDLKHDPHNQELLDLFHQKCQEFNELLKKINKQYENKQKDLGVFKTKN
jgi:nucleoid-associated protein YejK